MMRRLVVATLISLLILSQTPFALGQSGEQRSDRAVQELKDKLDHISRGKPVLVLVTLNDKSQIRGRLSALTSENFTISNDAEDRVVPYTEVRRVDKEKIAKTVLWIVGIAATVVIVGVLYHSMSRSHGH